MTEAWHGRTTGDPGRNWSVTDLRGDEIRPPGYLERAARQPASAYERWTEVSGRVLDMTMSAEVLEVVRAASAAMAELHDEIARLERPAETAGSPEDQMMYGAPERYGDMPFPAGLSGLPGPGMESRGQHRRRVARFGEAVVNEMEAKVDAMAVTPGALGRENVLSLMEGMYSRSGDALARELARLIRELAAEPGNRILIMERAAGIERELDADGR